MIPPPTIAKVEGISLNQKKATISERIGMKKRNRDVRAADRCFMARAKVI